MKELIDRGVLQRILRRLEAETEAEMELIVVGGCALLILAPDGEVTRDLDVLWTDSLRLFSRRLGEKKWNALKLELGLSTRSDPFEIHLPPDWRERARRSDEVSHGRLSVFSPAPEDLAVMKLFRFHSKDVEDIKRLARGKFDRAAFKAAFLATLPFALGDARWHAHSFEMLWNRLFPDSPVRLDDLLPARKSRGRTHRATP